MISCNGCERWYHGPCVGVSKAAADSMDDYVCPECASAATATKPYAFPRPVGGPWVPRRTRRPRLRYVSSLLLEAEEIGVELPEIAPIREIQLEAEQWQAHALLQLLQQQQVQLLQVQQQAQQSERSEQVQEVQHVQAQVQQIQAQVQAQVRAQLAQLHLLQKQAQQQREQLQQQAKQLKEPHEAQDAAVEEAADAAGEDAAGAEEQTAAPAADAAQEPQGEQGDASVFSETDWEGLERLEVLPELAVAQYRRRALQKECAA
jgi:hypothetical protein